jgi:hypothetical protein
MQKIWVPAVAILLFVVFMGFDFLGANLGAQEYQGPYAHRTSDANIAQQFIHLLDNASVGAVQTVVGAGHVIYYLIADGEVELDTHHNGTSEVNQIVVRENVMNACAYSLGLFQIGQCAEDHEGGHSVASAHLGPLYLPVVGLSYLIEGHDGSFLEDWADLDGHDANQWSWTNQVEVGAGHFVINGETRQVMIFKFSIDQTQVNQGHNLNETKMWRWFNTEIMGPVLQRSTASQAETGTGAPCPTLPEVEFRTALLSKDMELIVGRLNGDSTEHDLNFLIRTHQDYGQVESLAGALFVRPLTWESQFGAEYRYGDNVKLLLSAGLRAGMHAYSPERYDLGDELEFGAYGGVVGQADVELGEYVRLTTRVSQDWATDGSSHFNFFSGITNEYRNPVRDFGWLHSLEFSGGYRHENFVGADGTQLLDSNRVDLTAGIKF